MAKLKALKSLGQNFLLDLNLTRKIARTAGDLSVSKIIEVGPGPGGLTRALLLEGAQDVLALEQDHRAIDALAPLVEASEGRLSVLKQDAIKFAYEDLRSDTPLKIVANLPYNISTKLLVMWLERAELFSSLTLMFQKEVAERLVAEPKTKAYGRLSVMTQWRCRVRKCFDVPPEAFTPAPKVTSSIVHIVPKDVADIGDVSFKNMETITKTAFNQRRKMLRVSLKPLWGREAETKLSQANIDPKKRAEELDLQDFIALAKLI